MSKTEITEDDIAELQSILADNRDFDPGDGGTWESLEEADDLATAAVVNSIARVIAQSNQDVRNLRSKHLLKHVPGTMSDRSVTSSWVSTILRCLADEDHGYGVRVEVVNTGRSSRGILWRVSLRGGDC